MSDALLDLIGSLATDSQNRFDLWTSLLDRVDARSVVEIGVYKGAFAARILDSLPRIERYYMIDPWRHLEDWNKPANRGEATFERLFDEAMRATQQHEQRRVVLRGRTVEVIDQIPDGSLDFAYIDGDHTLRGITVDLVQVYPKIRQGGWIGGDDFSRTIWQHGAQFEPTLVFPFAVHFAEAVGARIFGLPHSQFLLEKSDVHGFELVDLAGKYGQLDLLRQMTSPRSPWVVAPPAAKPRFIRRVLARLPRG